MADIYAIIIKYFVKITHIKMINFGELFSIERLNQNLLDIKQYT